MRFIENFINDNPIDAEDITLMGFSQGAILSYAVALSYPEKIRRIVAMSGYLNLEIAVDDFATTNLTNLKIFASHGMQDQVIPIAWAQKAPEILKPLGIDIVFKSYAAAHGVAPQNFYDLKDWLKETKK
jgi:phospholipase/carboxylesterase